VGVGHLGTGWIEARFHCRGTTDVVIDLLNKHAIGLQKAGAPRRRDHAGRLSNPVAVFGSLSRMLNTCHSVTTSVQRQAAVCLRLGDW